MERNGNLYRKIFNSGYLKKEDEYFFKPPEVKYEFNIIGAGMIGVEHLHVTMLEGRARIHGIYDVDANSIAKMKREFETHYPAAPPLVVYETLDAACQDPAVDGLILSTPNYVHIETVRAAVQSGKHILLEKPMATTAADAYEIMALSKGYEGVFQIGLQYRYKAIYQEARHEVLSRKTIGDVKTISIIEHRLPFLDKVDNWNKFECCSGGTLVEKCCHYFDLFNLFAGAPADYVYAVGSAAVNYQDFQRNGKPADILDNAIVTVVYKNGITANFNLCMFAPMFYEELTICADKGRLRAYENDDYLPDERPSTHLEIMASEYGVSKISTPCYPAVIQNSGHKGGTYFEHKLFLDNIEGKNTDTATVAEGFHAVMVGLAAEQSVKTGKVVYLDDLLQQIKEK